MHGPGDIRFFDRVARLYNRLAPATDPAPIRAGLTRADRPVERVLDLAGGTGRAARAVVADRTGNRRDGENGTGIGADAAVIDASRPMLRRAAHRGSAAVQGDAGCLPLRDATVDGVVVLDALHHLPAAGAALADAARVLRPGGVLVVREFDPGTPRGAALAAAERLVGFDSTFRGPDATARVVADAGLSASVLDRGFAHTVVGRKRGSH